MKIKFWRKFVKLSFLLLSSTSFISVISCSFFNPHIQWLSNHHTHSSQTIPAKLNYADYSQLKQLYTTFFQNIETNYSNVFQAVQPKWLNFNSNLTIQLNYEWQQWNAINKSNNASYLATLYPELWSLNNALITLDWYYINYLLVQFISSWNKTQKLEFKFLPTLTQNTSYLFLLSKVHWISVVLNPQWLIFKHDWKEFLKTQNISAKTWNDNVKVFDGSWICLPNIQWTLSSTSNNTKILTLGFISFNWHMMNQDVPTCFSSNAQTNLNINNWNYFNNFKTNPTLCESNLKKVVIGYQTVQTIYNDAIKYLIF